MIYWKLFLVALVAVFVADLSGFMGSVKDWFSRWLGRPVKRLRPFDCPLCMTWWTCLAYAVGNGEISVAVVAYTAALAMLARPLAEFVRAVIEVLLSGCRMLADLVS